MSRLSCVPHCATDPGPAGNSCLSSAFLSGGNRQHRQVNTPDQAIRTQREGAGLASRLCSWGWPRDPPAGTHRVWFYSPSPNSAHQSDKGRSRDLRACGASLEQERSGNAGPGAGGRCERAKRHLQNAPQLATSRCAPMPQWHAVVHSVSCSPQYPPPAWNGALLLGIATRTFPALLRPGKTRRRRGSGMVPSRPALPLCLMWDLVSSASPRRLRAVIRE